MALKSYRRIENDGLVVHMGVGVVLHLCSVELDLAGGGGCQSSHQLLPFPTVCVCVYAYTHVKSVRVAR
jgi:hypothetical protein